MLLKLGQALGIVSFLMASVYLAPMGCRALLGDHLPQDDYPDIHPAAQPFMPQNFGNDPNHPIARLLSVDECHTEAMSNDADTITLQIQEIIDGDTIRAHSSEKDGERVRLWGIDAPESSQPYGPHATLRLAALLPTGRVIKARNMGRDQYGRLLAIIGDDGQLPINWEMVLSGLAHHYDYAESAGDLCLKEAQATAKAARLGLWTQSMPEEPWEWRSRQVQPTTPPLPTLTPESQDSIKPSQDEAQTEVQQGPAQEAGTTQTPESPGTRQTPTTPELAPTPEIAAEPTPQPPAQPGADPTQAPPSPTPQG